MLWFYENDFILNATFSVFTKTTDTFNKNKRCHMTLELLSSVCAKLEPASSENNECPAKIYIACLSQRDQCAMDHFILWHVDNTCQFE